MHGPGYQPPSPLNQAMQQFSMPPMQQAAPQGANPGLLAMLRQIMAQRAASQGGAQDAGDMPQRGYGDANPPQMFASNPPPQDAPMRGNPGGPSENQTKLLQMLLMHIGQVGGGAQSRPHVSQAVSGGIADNARGNIAPSAAMFSRAYI